MLSAPLELLPDVSRLEKSDDIKGREDGTSVGKDIGTCMVWEKDFAGVKSSSVKRAVLKGKVPVVENAKCRSLGVINHGHISMYS